MKYPPIKCLTCGELIPSPCTTVPVLLGLRAHLEMMKSNNTHQLHTVFNEQIEHINSILKKNGIAEPDALYDLSIHKDVSSDQLDSGADDLYKLTCINNHTHNYLVNCT